MQVVYDVLGASANRMSVPTPAAGHHDSAARLVSVDPKLPVDPAIGRIDDGGHRCCIARQTREPREKEPSEYSVGHGKVSVAQC